MTENFSNNPALSGQQGNPFRTSGSLGPDDQRRAREQSVCSLQDFLELAVQMDRRVIFDLYRPPRGHPYRDTWIQRTLEVIHNESSIRSSQVTPQVQISPNRKSSWY